MDLLHYHRLWTYCIIIGYIWSSTLLTLEVYCPKVKKQSFQMLLYFSSSLHFPVQLWLTSDSNQTLRYKVSYQVYYLLVIYRVVDYCPQP